MSPRNLIRFSCPIRPKTWGLWFLGIVFSLTILVLILNVTMDPLQIYRANAYAPLQSNSRHQNAGRLRFQPWTDLLIGTSLSENFSPKLAENLFGGEFINVSMPGSSLAEQYTVLQFANTLRHPESVIWGIDIFAMAKPDDEKSWREVLPDYLYSGSVWDDAPYLFSCTTAAQSWEVLKNRIKGAPVTADPDVYNNWHADARYGAEAVWGSYADFPSLVSSMDAYTLSRFKANYELRVKPLLESYRGTEFHLVLMPYSLPYCDGLEKMHPGCWDEWEALKLYLLEQKKQHPNLYLYDFQDRFDWVADYSKFKDVVHFHQDFSDAILQTVALRKEVSAQQIQECHQELKLQIEAMRPPRTIRF